MTMISLEDTLAKLELQVPAATVPEKELVTQRLRSLVAAIEPKHAPRAPVREEDDLLFDNVPV